MKSDTEQSHELLVEALREAGVIDAVLGARVEIGEVTIVPVAEVEAELRSAKPDGTRSAKKKKKGSDEDAEEPAFGPERFETARVKPVGVLTVRDGQVEFTRLAEAETQWRVRVESEIPRDHGPRDHGPRDHGPRDHGPRDHGPRDHGPRDHGPRDHGPRDHGPRDHGPRDRRDGGGECRCGCRERGDGDARRDGGGGCACECHERYSPRCSCSCHHPWRGSSPWGPREVLWLVAERILGPPPRR